MSSKMQQAVADAMAATGGAEAMPVGWHVFRPAGDSSERHAVAANGDTHKARER
jgi:hypothetical protein